jgi:DNA-binding CsgD family transcriptional regulator
MMLGRAAECAAIDELLADARAGHSGMLVLRGEPGIGKTTLLGYAGEQAAGTMRVLSARGYETESEIPFAGLADLLRPVLPLVPTLAAPQAAALASALALGPALAGERFGVCAATMSLLAAAAETSPVLLIIDDLHWLDASSKEALLFAGRRLQAEGIAMLLATRGTDEDDSAGLGLRDLPLTGLSRRDADQLCRQQLPAAPADLYDRLYAATAGNPLALLELGDAWSTGAAWSTDATDAAGAAGGDELTAPPVRPGSRLERALRARLATLPERTHHALLVAAAAGGGQLDVILPAAGLAGVTLADFEPAEAAGLITIDRRVEFRHPMHRSVLYHSASAHARCTAHAALATALADVLGDAAADARAWHLAAATLAPDDEVAALLEAAAVRARNRAGYIEAARAFAQAARLSRAPARPALLVKAARCWQLAGRTRQMLPLLDEAGPLATEPVQRAVIEHMSAYVHMWRGMPNEGADRLVAAAEQIEEIDPGRAAQMFADAGIPCFMLGDFDRLQAVVARAYELGRRAGGPAKLVANVALAHSLTIQRRRTAAAELLRGCEPELARANPLARAQDLLHAALAWVWLEGYGEAQRIVDRVINAARAAGALGVLPQALAVAAELYYRIGHWSGSRACAAESASLAEELRQANIYGLVFAARMDAVQGRDADCRRSTAKISAKVDGLGIACMSIYTGHTLGLLALGRGHTDEAIERLESVRRLPQSASLRDPTVVPWVFDLVEAYVRGGRTAEASALLAEHTPAGADEHWAGAASLRCQAMLAGRDQLAAAFEPALAALGRPDLPFERARTELCYGERLRRARQRAPARDHLRRALTIFEQLGAAPWAERARAELRATGETLTRDTGDRAQLTPQELQVALVVAGGATNSEAASALYLSRKTIEYHLSNIYRKTNIRSRAELSVLAPDPSAGVDPDLGRDRPAG